jgi:Tfp pilus assembly protein FimT
MKLERRSSRAGFTLTEIAVAMSTVALLSALLLPKGEALFAHSAVKAAAGEVGAKFRLAQIAATQGGRTSVVRMSYGRIWIEARPRIVPTFSSTVDTLGGVTDLALVHKVTVTSSLDSVVYTPTGLAAAGGVVQLARSGVRDSVVINALGMVKK